MIEIKSFVIGIVFAVITIYIILEIMNYLFWRKVKKELLDYAERRRKFFAGERDYI
jgi:hypothetical protein